MLIGGLQLHQFPVLDDSAAVDASHPTAAAPSAYRESLKKRDDEAAVLQSTHNNLTLLKANVGEALKHVKAGEAAAAAGDDYDDGQLENKVSILRTISEHGHSDIRIIMNNCNIYNTKLYKILTFQISPGNRRRDCRLMTSSVSTHFICPDNGQRICRD